MLLTCTAAYRASSQRTPQAAHAQYGHMSIHQRYPLVSRPEPARASNGDQESSKSKKIDASGL